MKTNTTILNCEVNFRPKCPSKWENLQASSEAHVKACNICQKQVFFCTSDEETLLHAEQGHCIARQSPDICMVSGKSMETDERNQILSQILNSSSETIGQHDSLLTKMVSPARTPEQEEALQIILRENAIFDAINNIQHTSWRCTECGYPFPKWWSKCRVCNSAKHSDK